MDEEMDFLGDDFSEEFDIESEISEKQDAEPTKDTDHGLSQEITSGETLADTSAVPAVITTTTTPAPQTKNNILPIILIGGVILLLWLGSSEEK